MSKYPPSVPAGGHEMRENYPNQDPPRTAPHTAPSLTPYLGLRARLSQTWINRWTILLLLVLGRTLITISSINGDLDSARIEALSACSGVESLGSAMASMPHYMSQGANELAAKGVEKAVSGLMDVTLLSVTGVEEIVVFVVNMLTSTYTCLIAAAVNGTVSGAVSAIEKAQPLINSSLSSIGSDIAGQLSTFNTDYTNTINAANKLSSLVGITFPTTLDLSKQITALENIKLPTDLTPQLDSIKANMPTFEQIQQSGDGLIRTPFDFAKSDIQAHLGNYTFDRSVFPVPAKESLTFCSDNDGINDFFDQLVHTVAVARTILIGVLLAAAILVCIPMAWREIRRWRIMQERSQLAQANAHDPMDVMYIFSRPYTSTAGIRFASKFNKTRRQILVRWVVAYATSDAALFVLSLALAGLFSAACHAIILKTLEREVPSLTNEVGAFADKVIDQLNNASQSWADGTNAVVASTSNDINQKMMDWVNITTHAVNETLNVVVNDTVSLLDSTFSGTILYQPILDVVNCLVLLKIAGIQSALTWVSDNAHVSLPTVPSDIFSIGAIASIASNSSDPSDSFLSTPGSDASDQISAAVDRFINKLYNTIRIEALVATAILGIYLLVVLIGILRALTLWRGRDKTRGEGGGGVPVDSFRAGPNPEGSVFQQTIPLEAVPPMATYARPNTPAPKYTSRVDEIRDPFRSPEDEADYHEEQKNNYGYAGHRDLSRNPTTTERGGRIVSSRAEVWGDYKS